MTEDNRADWSHEVEILRHLQSEKRDNFYVNLSDRA